MNTGFMKTSKVIDRILKIVQGFLVAGVIVSAIFIPLTAVLGEKVIADASTVEFGNLNMALAGNYHVYLNIAGIKVSIIVVLITAIITCVVGWLCLRKIRDILSPMKEGRPFEAGISKKIRQLALILFFLSYVFRYGEDLQRESDETL